MRSIRGRVLAFTFAVSLVTGILFGLVPALAASNPDLNETLKEGGRGGTGSAKRQRMRSAFVIAETTLALVLLVGAGLMLKSFWRLQRLDPGFNPDGVLTMRMMLPFEIYEKPAQRGAFYKQVLERIGSAPGVEAVSATSQVPLTQGGSSGTIGGENSAVGPSDLPVEAEWRWVTLRLINLIGVNCARLSHVLPPFVCVAFRFDRAVHSVTQRGRQRGRAGRPDFTRGLRASTPLHAGVG